MVALARLLDPREVGLEIGLREEGRAVHALHRLVAGVALPIGVRRAEQLERLQPARARDVRTRAEVDEQVTVADRVARHHRLSLGLLLDELDLEGLAPAGEELEGLRPWPHLAFVGQVGRRQLPHLLLDALEILGTKGRSTTKS